MSEFEDHSGPATVSRRQFLASSGALAGVAALSRLGGKNPLSLTHAGSVRDSAARSAGATLRYAEAGAFATLNPWVRQPVQADIVDQIFSRLLYLNENGKVVPDLAESWKLAPNARSMTFTLRPNLKWQDGSKVTAGDFVRNYRYLHVPALQGDLPIETMKKLLTPITKVTASNETTLHMEFSEPLPYIMTLLSYWYLIRIDNTNDTSFLQTPPIGTGPYKVTRFNQSTGAYLTAFDQYYAGKPAIKHIQFDTFSSGTSLVSDLRSGLVDGILANNFADLKAIAHNRHFYEQRLEQGVWDLMVNCAKPPFNNINVRQALSYSMNRKEIANAAFFGFEKPVSTPFFSPASLGYVKDLVDAQSFDLSKAKSLLDSAGVSNLTITFPFPTAYPTIQTLAEVWQSDLTQIGVNLQIQPVDTPLWESLPQNPSTDVVIWNNARCLLDPAIFWSTQLNFVPGEAYAMGYQDSKVPGLIATGAASPNVATRRAAYQQLNRRIVNSAHCISITTYSNVWAWSSKVHGATSDAVADLWLGNATFK